MKTITICDKEYKISCNAYTRFEYKKIFGVGIFEDIQKLNNFTQEQETMREKLKKEGMSEKDIEKNISNSTINKLDDFIDVLERLAYILIYTANKEEIGTFEEWLSGIDKIDMSAEWVRVVTEFTVESFC
jgi:predicted Zn-dependent peptidase